MRLAQSLLKVIHVQPTPEVNDVKIKMMMAALVLGSAVTVSGVAMAQGAGQQDGARAEKRAKMKELREARRAEMLAQFDTNRDGQLDDTERRAMREARATERFQSLDTNGDNVLSLDEFKAGHRDGPRRGFGKGRRGGR